MSWLSGISSMFGGGGGKRNAKRAIRESRWLPPSLDVGGNFSQWVAGDAKKGIPGRFSASLSPINQALQEAALLVLLVLALLDLEIT